MEGGEEMKYIGIIAIVGVFSGLIMLMSCTGRTSGYCIASNPPSSVCIVSGVIVLVCLVSVFFWGLNQLLSEDKKESPSP